MHREVVWMHHNNRLAHDRCDLLGIHFAILRNNQRVLTTQLYVKGDPQIQRDGPIRSIRDPKLRAMLIKDFAPLKGSKTGELIVNFDIVVGVTPEDPKEDPIRFRNPKYKKG